MQPFSFADRPFDFSISFFSRSRFSRYDHLFWMFFGWVLFFEEVIPLGESFVLPRRGIVTFDIQVDDF